MIKEESTISISISMLGTRVPKNILEICRLSSHQCTVRLLLFFVFLPAGVNSLTAQSKPSAPNGPSAVDEAIDTDRPDFTNSPRLVPPGMVQIEGGYTYSRTGSDKYHALGELLLRVPTGNWLELRFGINSYALDYPEGRSVGGLEDSSFEVKIRLTKGSEKPRLFRPMTALTLGTILPTGAPAIGEHKLQPGGTLAAAWVFSDRWSLTTNLNFLHSSQDGERFDQASASASLGYQPTKRLGGFVEYFTHLPGGNDGTNTYYLDSGITFLLNNNFQVDARIGVGLNGINPEYFFGFGLAHRWKRPFF